MADPLADALKKKAAADLFNAGFKGTGVDHNYGNRFQNIVSDSMVGDVIPGIADPTKSGYARVFGDKEISPKAKASYVLGRALHDLFSDGTRIPYWFLNHPLAITALASSMATDASGLGISPKQRDKYEHQLMQDDIAPTRERIEQLHAEKLGMRGPDGGSGLPLRFAAGLAPLVTTAALVQASDNHNLLNPAQGFRNEGYEALLPSATDRRETTNPLAEAAMRYIMGRTGKLLPWEEFTVERPDVSREDYDAARAIQYDKGPLGIGLIKATGRNLEGEPEATMMGFRVPLSAAATAVGGLAGTVVGAKALNGWGEKQGAAAPKALRTEGNRRMIGSVAGALAGALTGNLSAKAVNETVIQPTFYPEREAAEDAWRLQQQALGLL